ncbi:MAG: hypothetical protein ACPGSC_12960, partial [Granulosicoccaceae bacterium]
KLAAAAQTNPLQALDNLARAYIEQRYEQAVDAKTIAEQMMPVLDAVAGEGVAMQVLSHSTLRLQIGTVRCVDRGLASDSLRAQKNAFVRAFAANMCSRKQLTSFMQRVVFCDPRSADAIVDDSCIASLRVELSEQNFETALLASGSLPVYMQGVTDIPSAPRGVYRDGGLLDYHPVAKQVEFKSDLAANLVLYPHFFPKLTEGWLDKFLCWRNVNEARLADVVLICPSEGFVRSLELGAIPDRKDFKTYGGRDDERMRLWREAFVKSEQLGDSFLELCATGAIAQVVKPL